MRSSAVSGAKLPADSIRVANEPAPCPIGLSARDLGRIYRHWLQPGHLPLRVHQRDVASVDDLLDGKV